MGKGAGDWVCILFQLHHLHSLNFELLPGVPAVLGRGHTPPSLTAHRKLEGPCFAGLESAFLEFSVGERAGHTLGKGPCTGKALWSAEGSISVET